MTEYPLVIRYSQIDRAGKYDPSGFVLDCPVTENREGLPHARRPIEFFVRQPGVSFPRWGSGLNEWSNECLCAGSFIYLDAGHYTVPYELKPPRIDPRKPSAWFENKICDAHVVAIFYKAAQKRFIPDRPEGTGEGKHEIVSLYLHWSERKSLFRRFLRNGPAFRASIN